MKKVLNVSIPQMTQKFYPDTQKQQIGDAIAKIYAKYKQEIDTVADLTNVPRNIICSIIFIESGGNPTIVSGAGAVGLMQLIPSSASDILVIEHNKGRLTDGEIDVLTKALGDRFTKGIMKMKYLGMQVMVGSEIKATWVTTKDLYNPLLNILCGSIYLGLLLNEQKEGDTVRLDKVVIRYNKGYFADAAGKGLIGSIDDLLGKIPTESKNYVLKLIGTNGTLDSIVA